jgi:HAD superfamily hydrolase (TIGR01509 family)
MTLKAVIFDLDGVMVDTEPLFHRALNLAFKRHGLNRQLTIEEYGRVFVGVDVDKGWYASNLGMERAQVSEFESEWGLAYDNLIENASDLALMPGLSPLLNLAQVRGLLLAVASSTDRRRVETILRKLNLDSRFQAIVCGSDVLKIKPAPDIYLRVLEELRVPASSSLAIEDSAAGIAAAKAAGLRAIAVPNRYTQHQDLSQADAILDSLYQVAGWIEKTRI